MLLRIMRHIDKTIPVVGLVEAPLEELEALRGFSRGRVLCLRKEGLKEGVNETE